MRKNLLTINGGIKLKQISLKIKVECTNNSSPLRAHLLSPITGKLWVFMPRIGCHSGVGFVGQRFRNPPKLVDCWVPVWFDSLFSALKLPMEAWSSNKIYLNFVTLLPWETKSSYLCDYGTGKRNANCTLRCFSRQFLKLLSQSDFLIFKTLSTNLDQ